MTTRKAILCFMLVVCIAVLSACTAPPNTNSGETTGQSTGDTNQSTQSPDISFQWNSHIKLAELIPDATYDTSRIRRLTYDSCRTLIDAALTEHGVCHADYCYPIYKDTGECHEVRQMKSISYPKEFFEENTLLLVPVWHSSSLPFEIKEVAYEEGVLTCCVEYIDCQEPILSIGGTSDWSVLIEIDTVLPQDTKFSCEESRVFLPLEEFEQVNKTFEKLLFPPVSNG